MIVPSVGKVFLIEFTSGKSLTVRFLEDVDSQFNSIYLFEHNACRVFLEHKSGGVVLRLWDIPPRQNIHENMEMNPMPQKKKKKKKKKSTLR
eukprot:Trichotokara_eunicae@DN8101_c0_g1_i1.p1